MMPSIMSGSLIRETPPWARMSAGTRSSAITATAPASSAILACSGVTTSMMTPPLSISAMPRFTPAVPVPVGVSLLSFVTVGPSTCRGSGRARRPTRAVVPIQPTTRRAVRPSWTGAAQSATSASGGTSSRSTACSSAACPASRSQRTRAARARGTCRATTSLWKRRASSTREQSRRSSSTSGLTVGVARGARRTSSGSAKSRAQRLVRSDSAALELVGTPVARGARLVRRVERAPAGWPGRAPPRWPAPGSPRTGAAAGRRGRPRATSMRWCIRSSRLARPGQPEADDQHHDDETPGRAISSRRPHAARDAHELRRAGPRDLHARLTVS